jgi:hypothetical protein
MKSLSMDTVPDNIWRRMGRGLAYVRDWPANGNTRYSPLFCVSLLLASTSHHPTYHFLPA